MKKLLILLILFVFGCNDPLKKRYNKEALENDIAAFKKAQVDSTDIVLISLGILRGELQGKDMEGKSYQEILKEMEIWQEQQRIEEAKQKELAEKAKAEELRRIKRLREAVRISVFEKGFTEYNYQDYITYKFVLENQTNSDIQAVTGSVIFTDLFDKEIKTLNLTYDDGIKANSRINWRAQTDYNQFINEDQTLKNKDLNKIKVIWNPEKILFTDGSIWE